VKIKLLTRCLCQGKNNVILEAQRLKYDILKVEIGISILLRQWNVQNMVFRSGRTGNIDILMSGLVASSIFIYNPVREQIAKR